jgi:hypothetical protein
MAPRNSRGPAEVRADIAVQREELAGAVEGLRAGIADATNVGAKLRTKLPALTAGALGAGFFLGGGIGAVMRYVARRGREGHTRVRVGHYRIVEDD